MKWIGIRETDCVIHWKEICPVDSVVHLLNNWGLIDECGVNYLVCCNFCEDGGIVKHPVSVFVFSCRCKTLKPYLFTYASKLISIWPTTVNKGAKRSTMGKKTWLSMHRGNFGSDKIVPTYVRRLHIHVGI